MSNETIAAISTPLGPGGIGIIRVSGPGAYAILKRLFVPFKKRVKTPDRLSAVGRFSSHKIYYGHIIDPGSGNILDEVLSTYMKGPQSFTREDVVEIHSHSGFVVLDRILNAVVDAGAVLSGPGEFTKRAFLNGRIDITQAEAVIDLINAPCEIAVQMASRQVAGGLRDVLEEITETLTALQVRCEANIEFHETDENESHHRSFQETIERSILPVISDLVQRQKDTAIFKEGMLLAIAGVPNVGKSSLLNRLVERETAIVSEVPGTTRDIVREYFSIKGVPVVVCDTAGIHDTADPVECIGIEKARDHFNRADIVLLVLDATRSLNRYEEKLVEEFKKSKTIAVINKNDLVEQDSTLDIDLDLISFPHIRVSAKTGTGVPELKALIFKDLVSGKSISNCERVSPNLRQRKILEKTIQDLHRCSLAARNGQSLEILSGMVSDILHLLDEISGNRNREDLYDHIFSQFCVGK